MRKIYHLSTCSTCQRIISTLELEKHNFEFQDIKSESITKEQLNEMKAMVGSYEALFSRRAMKYRSMGLDKMELNESDYEKYILEEYTFLKRPVLIIDGQIFVGNSAKVVSAAEQALK